MAVVHETKVDDQVGEEQEAAAATAAATATAATTATATATTAATAKATATAELTKLTKLRGMAAVEPRSVIAECLGVPVGIELRRLRTARAVLGGAWGINPPARPLRAIF